MDKDFNIVLFLIVAISIGGTIGLLVRILRTDINAYLIPKAFILAIFSICFTPLFFPILILLDRKNLPDILKIKKILSIWINGIKFIFKFPDKYIDMNMTMIAKYLHSERVTVREKKYKRSSENTIFKYLKEVIDFFINFRNNDKPILGKII